MLTLNQTGVEHEKRSRKTCVLLNEVFGGMSCESWGRSVKSLGFRNAGCRFKACNLVGLRALAELQWRLLFRRP